MEKGWCLEGRGMLSIFLALNWKRLRLGPVEGRKQEWVWQKRLCFLIREKGSRRKGEGPTLAQPVGIPISSSGPALQEYTGSVGGCGLGLGPTPR